MTELFDAIRAGDMGRVSALLDSDAALADARNEQGVAALAVAKYNGRSDIAALLLQRGAKLDSWLAAMTGDAAALREQLSRDAGLINQLSSDGWTPLHLAAFFNQPDAARILLDAGAEVNARSTNPMANMALHAAAAGNANEVARMLIERGAAVNARQHGGWTSLHAAAQNGNTELARILIGAGADVRARADNQQSPMDLALTRGHQEMVALLQEFGADQ